MGGNAPQAGDSLVFPADATNFSPVNDYTPGTVFGSIDIQASGYDISGASIELTGTLGASLTSGPSFYQLDTTLDDGTVQVASGGELLDFGAIAGTSGLELTGGGGLTLLGTSTDTFTGDTTVENGTLTLEDVPGRYAVPGNLVIDSGGTVHYGDSYQVNPAATVTINGGLLNLEGNEEDLGALSANDGAQIYTGRADSINSGLLTLEGDVTSSGSSTFYGVMDLGPADRTFDVTDNTMTINGILQGSNALIKTGSGTLEINATNEDPGAVDVDAGVLDFQYAVSIDESSTDGITVASGATAMIYDAGTITVPVSIIGAGAGGVGALDSSLNNTLSDLILAGSATIGSDYDWPGLTIDDALTDGSGSGYSLTTVGGGEIVLAGANTYTGGTTVSGGELYVSGSIIGPVQTTTGGELGGSGTVGDAGTDGGIVGAGLTSTWDPEVEHYASLTLDSTATFSAQVTGGTPGSGGYDQVVVSGAVALNGATLSLPADGLPSSVVEMDLITGATSLTGTFNGLAEGAVVDVAGYNFKITYQGGEGGHDVVLNRVVATTTSVAIPTNSSVYSQPVSFTATVESIEGGTPTGTVTFYDGETDLGDATLSGNTATLTTDVLPVGSDEVTAVYNGDVHDLTSNSDETPVTQIVIQDNSSSSVTTSASSTVFGQSITFTATITAKAPGDGTPTGTVSFYDGTTLLAAPTLTAGQATYTTTSLAPGTHRISAAYAGDSGFFQSYSSTITQAVAMSDTTVAAPTSSGPTTFGDPVTFTAVVAAVAPGSGTPTGTVTFYDGETSIGTGTLDDTGTATLTLSTLDAGTHSITAEYGGDLDFTGSTSTDSTSQVVSAMATTTSLTTSPASPASVAFGQPVTLTATVAAVSGSNAPAGTVTFYDGQTAIDTVPLDVSDEASLTTGTLGYGSHTITAVYNGQTDFSTSTSSDASVSVSLASATIQVTSTTNPASSDESIVLVATVSAPYEGAATPTGPVTFYSGTTQIATGSLDPSGMSTVTVPPMPVGTYSITVYYGGDSDYQSGTSSAMTLMIEKPTILTVSAGSESSVYGEPITLTATVTPQDPDPTTPTGTVTFLDGETALGTGTLGGTGQATFTTAALGLGAHSISVVYLGDANYAPNTSSTTTLTVDPASTTTTLSTADAAPAFGQPVTLTATVAAMAPGSGIPAGTASFYDGSTLLGTYPLNDSGSATDVVSGLSIGSHPIEVVYSGNDDFTTSTSTTTTEDVQQAATTIVVVSSGVSRTYGEPVTFTATVEPVAPGAGIPSGTVTFYSGTTPIGSAGLAGEPASASITVSGLDAGTFAITAGYAGDAEFTGATSAAIGETVSPAATMTILRTSGLPAAFGQPETLVATVTTVAPGVGTPTGMVQFFDGTTPIGSAGLVNGVATLRTTGIPEGSQTLTASLIGSTDFLTSYSPPVSQQVTASSTQTDLSVSGGGSAVLGQSVTFTVTVLPVAPATVTPTGYVLFEDGPVPIASAALDANGVAAITTSSLGLGMHTISAIYSGDAGYTLSMSASASMSVGPCLGGTVYLDLDTNRSLAVGGQGLAGQTVFLDLQRSGVLSPGDPTATTGADGQFQFLGYAAGAAPVLFLSGQGSSGHYVVDRQGLDATGDVVIGVMPTSAITPLQVLVNPSTTGLSPSSDPRTGFIESLYADVLGRAGTASEVAGWVRRMERGMSRRKVVHRFVNSLAHRRAEVAAYSQEFLDQPAIPGSNGFVRALRSGVPEEKVVQSILDSPAYRATHQDPALFVRDLYIEVLGQTPSTAEVASVEGRLSSGMSRRTLVTRLVESSSVDTQIVDSDYASYLHQQPTAAGLKHWTSVLRKPGGSASKVAIGILASRAFYQESGDTLS